MDFVCKTLIYEAVTQRGPTTMLLCSWSEFNGTSLHEDLFFKHNDFSIEIQMYFLLHFLIVKDYCIIKKEREKLKSTPPCLNVTQSMSIHDEGDSRDASYTLNYISTFYYVNWEYVFTNYVTIV